MGTLNALLEFGDDELTVQKRARAEELRGQVADNKRIKSQYEDRLEHILREREIVHNQILDAMNSGTNKYSVLVKERARLENQMFYIQYLLGLTDRLIGSDKM